MRPSDNGTDKKKKKKTSHGRKPKRTNIATTSSAAASSRAASNLGQAQAEASQGKCPVAQPNLFLLVETRQNDADNTKPSQQKSTPRSAQPSLVPDEAVKNNDLLKKQDENTVATD